MVKVREDRSVRTRACYLAIGVTLEGEREVALKLLARCRRNGRVTLTGDKGYPAGSSPTRSTP